MPGAVSTPTSRVMEKVQASPGIPAGARLAPEIARLAGTKGLKGILKSGVKVQVDPTPQQPFPGVTDAVARMLSKKSSKVMSVALEVVLVLVIVKPRRVLSDGR